MNVGDYVRLDRCQGINRIEEYDEDIKRYKLEEIIADDYGDETFILDENDVVKSSPNIIDLIEIGDYFNGHRVIFKGKNEIQLVTGIFDINKIIIKSIVTKEQFSQMEYNVGE